MSIWNPATILKIDRANRLIGRNPKTVVFVTPLLRPREIKMASALRSNGWKIVLLYKQTTPFDPSNFFDLAIKLADEIAMHRVAKILEPRLCHVFSGAVDEGVLRFCRDKPSLVIVDLNDIFCPSLFNYLHERFEPTRECLALADGLVCRDLQPKMAERLDRYDLPPKILMFPEYPWIDGPAGAGAKAKGDPNEVRIVSVGTFTLETQGMFDSAYLQMARMLAEQKIHFHIYPHWFYRDTPGSSFRFDQNKDFADFVALEQETPYVHLHDSLPVEELARELPQYDFGIVAGGSAALGQKLDFLTPNYMQVCYSGRIADYLDARLPVIINREVGFNHRMLAHYGVGIDLGGILQPGFRDRLLAFKTDPELRQRVSSAAEQLDLGNQSARLSHFYEELLLDRPVSDIRVPIWMRASKRLPVFGRRIATVIEKAQEANRGDWVEARNARLRNQLDAEMGEKKAMTEAAQRLLAALGFADQHAAGQTRMRDHTAARLDDAAEQVRKGASGRSPGRDEMVAKYYAALEENHALQARLADLRQELQLGGMQVDEIAGLLNWPEISNDKERSSSFTELLRMTRLFVEEGRRGVGSPGGTSSAWSLLNRKNLDQLLADGYRRFKRTIALNYFTFAVQAGDPQIATLETLIGEKRAHALWALAEKLPDDPDFEIRPQTHFRYLMLLLWDHALSVDVLGVLNKIEEPPEGAPVSLTVDGARISQDLANSAIEMYSIAQGVDFSAIKRVAEIGGGYGRNAYMLARSHPHLKIVMVDIPPSLYLSQRYLSSVLPQRQAFRVRDFESFDEVRPEMEAASLVFLLPHQLAMIPDDYLDLTINISSFGEMTRAQIEYYFNQIDRTTRGAFFSKQWVDSKNPFDSLALTENDYPVRSSWRKIFSNPCATNEAFFESLYETRSRDG
ncbi:putative sugar O-methyltransferase [Bosea sp. 124]|uniref:putative sugar O-methyltransferase n=1 Tax=Bosea sp. 124 TaxID=2135642 RepID=UPI000D43C1A6|nr:putative sugar O-methyltransferase [Bosea sp. 124]PTM40337.1 putative sugar O-methyltransferase [Bosea sp. 124]